MPDFSPIREPRQHAGLAHTQTTVSSKIPLVLLGQIVELQPMTLAHAEALLAAASGDRTSFTYTSVPDTLAAMRDYIGTALADAALGNAIPFVTINRRTQSVIGTTRFCGIERWQWPPYHPLQHQRGTPDAVEIGWTWLSPDWQRSGANREAKLLMLSHAFDIWKVERVSLRTDERNERSRRAIESLGGKLDGILRANMPSYDGIIRNSAFYSILAREWPDARARLRASIARDPARHPS